MENKYTHGVLFYHEHSGLKNINQGIGGSYNGIKFNL